MFSLFYNNGFLKIIFFTQIVNRVWCLLDGANRSYLPVGGPAAEATSEEKESEYYRLQILQFMMYQ